MSILKAAYNTMWLKIFSKMKYNKNFVIRTIDLIKKTKNLLKIKKSKNSKPDQKNLIEKYQRIDFLF